MSENQGEGGMSNSRAGHSKKRGSSGGIVVIFAAILLMGGYRAYQHHQSKSELDVPFIMPQQKYGDDYSVESDTLKERKDSVTRFVIPYEY